MPLTPASKLYLKSHYDREREERENQSAAEKQRILAAFLLDGDYQDTPSNRGILEKGMGNDFYDFGALRAVAKANARTMEHKAKPTRPLKRAVTLDEVFALFGQVQKANASWLADTAENKRRVCELFTSDDQRISRELNLADMVTAVRILSATLDRVPSPEPPRFPDDDLSQPLSDGELPLPLDAPPYVQRKASVTQMRNLVARLKRQEIWQRQQESH